MKRVPRVSSKAPSGGSGTSKRANMTGSTSKVLLILSAMLALSGCSSESAAPAPSDDVSGTNPAILITGQASNLETYLTYLRANDALLSPISLTMKMKVIFIFIEELERLVLRSSAETLR